MKADVIITLNRDFNSVLLKERVVTKIIFIVIEWV